MILREGPGDREAVRSETTCLERGIPLKPLHYETFTVRVSRSDV
jgi:hypothetical protein